MAKDVTVKHEKKFVVVRLLDAENVDYESYDTSLGVVFTINSDSDDIIDKIEELNIG